MPTTYAPYGLEMVSDQTAASTNMATRQFWIDPTYATALFKGDVATLLASGYVARTNGVATAGTDQGVPIGVFAGFEFTSAVTKQRLNASYFPGASSVVTTDPIFAFINDDPNALFAVQYNATVNSTASTLALLGSNANLVTPLPAGSVAFQRSRYGATGAATTATLPLRIVDFVRTANNPFGTASVPQYMNLIVRFNTHQYLTALGV